MLWLIFVIILGLAAAAYPAFNMALRIILGAIAIIGILLLLKADAFLLFAGAILMAPFEVLAAVFKLIIAIFKS